MLRFYFKLDPDKLSDADWAARYKELEFALKYDIQRQIGEDKKK